MAADFLPWNRRLRLSSRPRPATHLPHPASALQEQQLSLVSAPEPLQEWERGQPDRMEARWQGWRQREPQGQARQEQARQEQEQQVQQ